MRGSHVAMVAIAGAAFVLARYTAPATEPRTIERVIEQPAKPQIVYVDRETRVPVAAPATPDEPEATTEVTPEQRTAMMTVERTVASAITARRWTEAERRVIHAQAAELDGSELQALMRPLVIAINRQEIETDGPLL